MFWVVLEVLHEFFKFKLCNYKNIIIMTHLGWPSDIGLELESVLLLNVSGLIPSGVNLDGLIYLLQKK